MKKKEDKEIKEEKIIEETPKKTPQTWMIIVTTGLLCILFGIGGWYLGNKFYETENKGKTEEKDKTETPLDENLKYKITLYSCTADYISEVEAEYCNEKIFEIPTETKEAKVLATSLKDFVLYDDNGLKIYNNKTKDITKIDLKNEYTTYELNLHHNKEKVVGVVYRNESEETNTISDAGYYNIEQNKKLYDKKYNMISAINENYIQGNTFANENSENDDGVALLLNANEEKIVRKEKEGTCKIFSEKYTDNGSYIVIETGCIGIGTEKFYTKDFKAITKELESYEYELTENGELYVLDNNKVNVYNTKGDIVKNYKTTGSVKEIFSSFYLTVLNQKLYITYYDNSFKKELGTWTKDNFYHWPVSGYYTSDMLELEEEKKEGYYFIVGNGDEGEENPESGTEYFFDPKTKETDSWDLEEIGGYAKPILYLYPDKTTEVEVNFEHEENLTTTYPKFDNSWKITANPNGDLYDKNGKYYYGLYWEENKNHEVNFEKGFYVTKENAITFLEEKLSTIGLNEKERNEFIMYWLPILEKNGQSLVYFELTEEREKYNKLEITPAPDSLLRIAIHVKKVNKPVKIKEQHLTSFNRHGFTAVEWGGILYN